MATTSPLANVFGDEMVTCPALAAAIPVIAVLGGTTGTGMMGAAETDTGNGAAEAAAASGVVELKLESDPQP